MRIAYQFNNNAQIFETPQVEIVIGRSKHGVVVDLDLGPDPHVSRRHARLVGGENGYMIEDLGSMAGTLVNHRDIAGKGLQPVKPNDIILIGSTELSLRPPDDETRDWTSEVRLECNLEGRVNKFRSHKPEIFIGRPKVDVVIDVNLSPDLGVSRPHARIFIEDGRFFIEDLKSRSGTRLNGQEIQGQAAAALSNGDRIRISRTEILFTARADGMPDDDDDDTKLPMQETVIPGAGMRYDLGCRIGSYEIEAVLGHGGQGTVFLARELGSTPRRVAIKIPNDTDDPKANDRFLDEARILARLNHPNIATVLRADYDDTASPYVVMEYVPGEPLTDYCNAQNLPINERLVLFLQVCRAVQFAHGEGVLHRDLSPSNILVTAVGDLPLPKIIDFGLATASGLQRTMRLGTFVGKDAYCSPEQIQGKPIDRRSDIYSLGAVLYELLVGNPPFEVAKLQAVGHLEAVRILREEVPPLPSERIKAARDEIEFLAKARDTEPDQLILDIASLDGIAKKAIAKDPTKRYQSVTELARDIRHWISQHPTISSTAASYRPKRVYSKGQIMALVLGSVAVIVAVWALTQLLV